MRLSPSEHRALGLVNKKCRALAEPFLYSRIQWTWLAPQPPAAFVQFLRRVLARPQLAAHITHLHLDGDTFRYQGFGMTNPKIPISSAELDEPVAFIRRTGVPFGDLWVQELRQGTIDAFVALLLAQSPNLKCLYLGHNFTQHSALIGKVLRSTVCEAVEYHLPTFRQLREVYFLLADSEDEARDKKVKNTADILPFFYLPNLKHLSASIENPDSFTWPAACPPVQTKLKSLDLSRIREDYLRELLSVTPNLETLRWHWYFDSGVEDRFVTQILDLDRLAAAISHVRDTLSELTLSAEVSIGGSDPFYPAVKLEGSLHAMAQFGGLKKLQIPWPLLAGFEKDTTKRLRDFVPKNIESLVITDDLRLQNEDKMDRSLPEWEWTHSTIVDVLQSWLKDWKTCTPHLRRISLVISVLLYEPDDWSTKLTHQLRDLSTQTGVHVELINVTDEM